MVSIIYIKMGKAFHGVAPNRGALFLIAESYGTVRCVAMRCGFCILRRAHFRFGFVFILLCGAVRFDIVRCGGVHVQTAQTRTAP